MGMYSNTTANAYADQIKVVYEYLDEIRKVGGRLTPVEDLTSFQAQIAELHGYLDLLVEASNIIVTATPTGEAILTGSVPSIRTLLGIDNLTGNWVQPEDLQAALDALRDLLLSEVEANTNAIAGIDVQLVSLEQYAVYQQSEINGLQISYGNVAAGLETNQTNTEQALSRLTIREQHATLQDLRLDTIDQSLVSTVLGIQATNDIVAGHTASISTIGNTVNLHTTSIDSLASTLTTLDGEVTANATAIDLMETNITAVGDDITAESNRITELRSVIGGSGNLLPNAEFASNANGWDIVVAEEDWATTLLTVDLFNMPAEVHCLEVLGTPTPLGQIVVESSPVLIQGGKHHIVSGYPCVDNGTITLSYKTFNAAGAVLDQGVCPATFNATTSTNINDYTRTWVKFLAAETAVKMRLYMTVTGDGDFVTQGALFRPMVEQSWEGQEEPTAWTPNLEGVPQALAEATEELTTRITSIEGVNTAQASSITTLEARATTIEGVNTSQATAISGLDTRVTAAEGINTAQSSSIMSLDSRVTAAEGVNTSQATAITGLDTRVTAAEGVNTSQASALTTLDSRVTATEGTNSSQATAISGLDTRVTATENTNTSQATSITTLNSQIANKADVSAVTALTTRVTDVEQGGYGTNLIPNSTMSTGITGYTYTQASTPSWSAPTLNLAGAPWHPARINALGVNNTSGGLASGQYINVNTMNAEIGRAGETFIASVYVACHRCQGQIYIAWLNAAGGVISYSGGTSYNPGGGFNGGTDLANWVRLVATGTAPAGTQSAQVFVQFQGNGSGTPHGWMIRPMLERKRATQTLPSEWNAGGVESFASWSVTLDVNGYVTGVTLGSDGTTSAMNIRADLFSIVSPGGGARTEFSSGNWRVYDASNVLRVRMGIW